MLNERLKMKKLTVLILSVLMLTSLFAAAASAQSFNANGHWDLDEVGQIEVKKADPADVIKDGIIGENEYERLDVDLSPDTSFLHRVYVTGQNLLDADAMLATMEYYFSWDEVHGFNFAIRNTHPLLFQQQIQQDKDPPEDEFCFNAAYVFAAHNPDDTKDFTLYYALAKRTDTGEYLEGHYNQLGLQGSYNPTPDVDYVITYSGNTSLIEWSVPIDAFLPDAGAGSTLLITLTATGGTAAVIDQYYRDFYAIVLGDFGFGVEGKYRTNFAEFLLSDEPVKSEPADTTAPYTTEPDQTTEPGDTAAPGTTEPGTAPATINDEQVETKVNDKGETVYIDKTTGKEITREEAEQISSPATTRTPAPRTGDPMIVIAAVSALGVCGAVVIKRKFF